MRIQLVYSSRKNPLEPGDIFRIQETARAENAQRDITGLLLFNRNFFLQCLEGDAQAVTSTFTRIAGDPRHSEVALLTVQEIAARSYPDWSMGLVDSTSPSLRVILRDLLPDYDFDPARTPLKTTMAVMQRMRTLAPAALSVKPDGGALDAGAAVTGGDG